MKVEDVGKRIVVQSDTDMAALGSALHGCIACSVADPSRPISDEQIREVLIRWGVHGAVTPEAVRFQVEAFQEWWQSKWPDGTAQAELPIQVPRPDGTVIRGQIDLLIRIATGRILIDHKADPRGVADGERLAATHGGQLRPTLVLSRPRREKPYVSAGYFCPLPLALCRSLQLMNKFTKRSASGQQELDTPFGEADSTAAIRTVGDVSVDLSCDGCRVRN